MGDLRDGEIWRRLDLAAVRVARDLGGAEGRGGEGSRRSGGSIGRRSEWRGVVVGRLASGGGVECAGWASGEWEVDERFVFPLRVTIHVDLERREHPAVATCS